MSEREAYDGPEDPTPRPSRRPRILLLVAAGVVVFFFLLTTFASLYTDGLWYHAGGYGTVFGTLLRDRLGLFIGFALVMAVAVGGNMVAAYRLRPFFRPDSPEQSGLDRYRDAVTPIRTWLLVGTALVLGAFAGASASGQWRSFLLWRHGRSFGVADPYFHRDVGFYVFDLPWLHFLTNFAMAVVVLCLIAAAAVHYLYGGIRLQATQDRLSPAAQAQFSVLLGVFVLIKAVDYWLDRYDLVTAPGKLITGMTFTDDHAVLPARNILVGIALICAVLFFLNLWRRTWLLPSVGIALLALSSILLGLIWPGIVQQFQVVPAEPDKERPYLATNIAATREAYGLNPIKIESYTPSISTSVDNLVAQTSTVPVVDPALVQKAFEQEQQGRAYYTLANVLDVDHYDVGGFQRAVVLGARELDTAGISVGDQNWSNLHTVYTHGNGLIAAFANQRPESDQAQAGNIQWAQGQAPGQDALQRSTGKFQGQIYFGEKSPDYSIVGKDAGAPSVELDLNAQGNTTTYAGGGGVGVGGFFHKLMYAVKFGDPNFVLSARVGSQSQVLYYRDPVNRVEKVAPWLTVDSDPYPAVVNGHVLWVVDGYTTSDRYPQAQRESFAKMTDDSLAAPATTTQALPTDEINYMRNAVKATVDAYTGKVTLYGWDESDPMLQTWEAAFPGTVQPRGSIPPALLQHLRYPVDQFKVQRYQFARYHVTNPIDFYQGNDRWDVPEDPEVSGHLQPPYRLFTRNPDTGQQMWSLTSNYVPRNKANLIGFVSVDSDATSNDYGQIRVLKPPDTNTPGPGLVAANLVSDPHITKKVQSFRLGGASPAPGNLLTVPLSAGLMYVQPVYATAADQTGGSTYATLRYVQVSYGSQVGIGETLTAAISDMVGRAPSTGQGGSGSGSGTGTGTGNGKGSGPGKGTSTGTSKQKLRTLLDRADRDLKAADQALQDGNAAKWIRLQARGKAELARALKLLG